MKKLLMIVVAMSLIASCSNDEKQAETEVLNYNNMTLSEFINSVSSIEEQNFFKNAKYFDKNYVIENNLELLSSRSEFETLESGVKFKWGGKGCDIPLGVCLIIIIKKKGVENSGDFNAILTYDGENIILTPTTEENGLTSDGFLPVFDNLILDEEIYTQLGLNKPVEIEAGVYKAFYDEKSKSYSHVVLNLK